mmetsp:Transcript_41947/g.88060  ORF Transcript_41947/g.88060 Transcript_41947/m.88060 type:complete len:523 (-) Transcript_41947:1360-2928(-)
MSSKGGDTSPVRVSRLKKKRRRPIKECPLLQPLPATMKQISRQALVDGNSKANILNHGLPSSILSGRQILGKHGRPGCAMVGKDEWLGTMTVIALQRGAEDSSLQFAEDETIMDGERSSLKICTTTTTKPPCDDHIKSKNKSTLEFMDHMDPSALLSAIPSMLGIDNTIMMRYQSCAADFRKELEQAFECNVNPADDNGNNDPRTTNSHDISTQNERIYHGIVGRIDCPNMVRDPEERSIAFPRCNSGSLQHPLQDDAATRKEENSNHHAILQHLNLRRKTGHGMRITASCYRFPLQETSRRASPDISLVNNCKEDGQQQQQLAKIDVEEQSAVEEHLPSSESILENQEDDDGQLFVIREQTANSNPPLTQIFSFHSDDDDDGIRSPNGHEKGMSSRSSQSSRTSLNYKGKIKIISSRGATIREVSDIDQSYHVIGKLHEGDERYFIEKTKLLPPPIEVDNSDDESDVECVPVIRYKIVLNPTDGGASDQFRERISGQMVPVGWISDRGRLADDAYSILREL